MQQLQNIFLADIFDVLIIALFIYAGILLFKQTRSLSILIGIGFIIALYGIAQLFNLYLTALLLRSFFGVFLLVLVVIFQEELRRFFEFIALVGTRQAKHSQLATSSPIINAIMQAVANFSNRNVGALIVFAGRENIERHIEGGTILDGIISQDLLESIFDPTSPGHDGAVIIHKNRISLLGSRLPLSNNFSEIGKHGTRHAAALGIAERSDALAIVVSEEHGTISIAYSGKLIHVENIHELEKFLKGFTRDKFPHQASSVVENIIKKNSWEKLLAVGIAGLVWFFLAYQAGSVQRDFIVPISYRNLKEEYIIESSLPKTVTVTLESRGKAFEQFDPKTLEVSIDAGDFTSGRKNIAIGEQMIKHPFIFSVLNFTPSNIQLTVGKYTRRELPVEVRTTGRLANGFVAEKIIAFPSTIPVLLSENVAMPLSVLTEPISIAGLSQTATVNAKLVISPGMRLENESELDIKVTIVIRKK